MKNIAIFGSSRSGKSTLAKMISKKIPNYHIIVGDDIQYAFQETLPNCNINNYGGIGMIDDFPRFLATLFYKSSGRNNEEFGYIVETCDMTPEKAKELFSKPNTVLLFIGTPNISAKKHLKDIRQYETDNDWTFNRSDESLLEHCKHWIRISKDYEIECQKLNIWYVDTSKNREKTLEDTLNKIITMLKDN